MLKLVSHKIKHVQGYSNILGRITASGLPRIVQHMLSNPFAIMSASRNERSEVENIEKARDLKRKVRSVGYGFVDTLGAYVEEGLPVLEDSIFIPNISQEEAAVLAREFDQESYIFGSKGEWWQANDVSTRVEREAGKERDYNNVAYGGKVPETFEHLHNVKPGEEYPYLSQVRKNPYDQFRLDTELPARRRQQQERYDADQGKIARLVVPLEGSYFFAMASHVRPKPPVSFPLSGIHESSEEYPSTDLLSCWLPLQGVKC